MGRDSHKGQYLGGSHLLTFFPTFCDCNTRIEKNGPQIPKNNNKFAYDKKHDKNALIYINKCTNIDILSH